MLSTRNQDKTMSKKQVASKSQTAEVETASNVSTADEALPDVRNWVKQVRCEIKDKSRKEKLLQIVQYSVQEALKQTEKVKVSAETFKNE